MFLVDLSHCLFVCLWLCPHFCRLFPNPPGNTRTFQKCQIFPDPPGNTRTLCFGSPFSGMGFCLLFPNFWVFDGSGDHFRETSKFVENSWGVYICVRGKFSPPMGAAISPRLGIVVHRVDYHKSLAASGFTGLPAKLASADAVAKFRHTRWETQVYLYKQRWMIRSERLLFFAVSFSQSLYIRYPVERHFGQSRKCQLLTSRARIS